MEIYHDEDDRRNRVSDHEERRVHETARLGLSERWILSGAGLILMAVVVWAGNAIVEQGKGQDHLITEVAVANAQLAAIQAQLSQVPQNTQSIAQNKIRVDRNVSDIRDMRKSIKELQRPNESK